MSSPSPEPSAKFDASSCSAVLVTYFPDLEVLDRVLAAVLPQVGRVIVVDNGSSVDIAATSWGRRVEVLALGRNFGIAYAHNRGLEAAMRHGSRYALLLDQDSVPNPDMVERLAAALRAAAQDGYRAAAAGPRYLDPRTGRESFFPVLAGWWQFRKVFCGANPGRQYLRTDVLISAGTLIRTEALLDIGPMCEPLFIDEVDTEWCLRARSKGYAVVGACGTQMHHTMGAHIVRVKLRREHAVPVHSPVRLYYMARNHFLLQRMPHVPGRWSIPSLRRLVMRFVLFSFLVPPRWQNARMMLRGVWDGLRSRSGPYTR